MTILKKILQLCLWIIGIISITLFLRVFLFSLYTITTPSMEPNIMTGDRIIVNKLKPGPRIFQSITGKMLNDKPKFWRLKGIGNIKRNDVLVFNFPYTEHDHISLDLQDYYVKRCIAIPGDTLRIVDGFYRVAGCIDTLGAYEAQANISHTPAEAFAANIYHCFPFDSRNWTIKQFGPLYVPAKGDSILIDLNNVALYKNIIEYESCMKITIDTACVWLGRNPIGNYTFQTNYYFVSGDFGYNSYDSRYWGLLPEDHVIGVGVIVWRSKDLQRGVYRRERFLKQINK